MTRTLAALAFVAALAAVAGAGPAQATNECRGLQVCVRVAGPWVVVPAGLQQPRPVDFRLSCPRGYVIGGLDAELTDRTIDVAFSGTLGSPVGPGVTTSRSALFRASFTGAASRGPSFRPHLGCLPTAGGGAGPVPFRLAAFPPGEPTIQRVRTVRLRPGSMIAAVACAPGERLLSGWHAVGFYTRQAPSLSIIRSVRATRALRERRVEVRVTSAAAVGTVRAIVQIGAVCGGGS